MTNPKTEEFKALYATLETKIRKKYNLYDMRESPIYFLAGTKDFYKTGEELYLCADIRNHFAHNPPNEKYRIEIPDACFDLLKDTIEKVDRILGVMDIAIKRRNISYCTLEDSVRKAMVNMEEKHYTHIPILKNDVVFGVFSENTLLSYLIDDEVIGIDSETKFSDPLLMRYLPIEKHRSEKFDFISKDAYLPEINKKFEQAFSVNDRLGLLFVTENGLKTEKMLGIITAWDIAGLV